MSPRRVEDRRQRQNRLVLIGLAVLAIVFSIGLYLVQSREDLPTEADDVFETAREALDRMRGNRSSSLYTFFDSAGQMRVIQRHPPEHWTAAARGLRGCAEDLLLAKLEQALELPNVETAVRETNPD